MLKQEAKEMKTSKAEVIREYGPFPEAERVNGVSFDGEHIWFASGNRLNAFDPESGKKLRSLDVAGHAGTAFDGKHLYQIAENRIQKIDPKSRPPAQAALGLASGSVIPAYSMRTFRSGPYRTWLGGSRRSGIRANFAFPRFLCRSHRLRRA
jgi:hypothetical protein